MLVKPSNHTYMLARGAPPSGVLAGDNVWDKLKYAIRAG
jgi:hypothetical protein